MVTKRDARLFAISVVLLPAVLLVGCHGAKCHRRGRSRSWTDVYEEARKSTVCVYGSLAGGGVILNEMGYVLTNNHLVDKGDGSGRVQMYDGRWYPMRRIAGERSVDIAVLQIQGGPPLTRAKLGRSSEMRPGDPIIAIGNPTGTGQTITAGIIGGLGRPAAGAYTTYTDMMVIGAGSHAGNSGGPVINRRGEVVGINSARHLEIGFAYPIDKVLRALPGILDVRNRYGFEVGMKVDPVSEGKVTAVARGSPAEAGGVKAGDVITHVDKVPLRRGMDFYLALIGRSPGYAMDLTLRRDGRRVDARVILRKVVPRPAEDVTGLTPGLNTAYYKGQWQRLPDFEKLKPEKTGVATVIDAEPYKDQDLFGLRFTGYVKVPADGAYRFYTTSDDGSRLWVGDELVVDNDGLHGAVERRGTIWLEAGPHSITVSFFERSGGEHLIVQYEGPGIKKQAIPESVLFHK